MTAPSDGLLISAEFWIAFAVYAIIERSLVGLAPRQVHLYASAAATAGFLYWFTGVDGVLLATLYVGLTVFFLSARGALETETAARRVANLLAIVGLVATIWALGKIGSSLELTYLSWLFFLGSSFLLVKIWTFSKDLYDGRIRDPDLATFLLYCTFFPCFISGPMHYYGEFSNAFGNRLPLTGRNGLELLFRITHGLVKVLILATILRPFSLEGIQGLGISDVGAFDLLARSIVYSFVIYLDFSGYSDIAVGAGGVLGIRVPENFNLPYLSRSIREFWQSWHITFTRFLTQYLFVPLTRALPRYAPSLTGPSLATSAYLATFLFCGFWHGSTWNYLAWGAYHGIGMAVYDVYRQRRVLRLRRAGKSGD